MYDGAGVGGTSTQDSKNGLVIITYEEPTPPIPTICIPNCPPRPIPKPGVAFGGTENIVGFEATQVYRYQTLVSLPFTSRASGQTRIINTQLNKYGYKYPPPPPRNRFN
jgi:hypothetical protein